MDKSEIEKPKLTGYARFKPLQDELAALKAENTDLKGNYNEAVKDIIERNNTIKQLSLENERLKKQLDDTIVDKYTEFEQLQAENERLKEVNERLTKACDSIQSSRNEMDELWKKSEAEKAELVGALKSCKEEVMFQSSGYARQVYIICDLFISKHSPE